MQLRHGWALGFVLVVFGCSENGTASGAPATAAGTGAGTAAAGSGGGAAGSGGSTSAARAGTGAAAGAPSKAGTGGATTPSAQAGASGAPDDEDAGVVPPVDGGAAPSGTDLSAFKSIGVDKYIGAAKPASMRAGGSGETTYTFDVSSGPECLRGDPYSMGTRDQQSDSLLIYLQGGGSCSSAVCSATTTANGAVPSNGIMNPNDSANPVAKWNLVYVPYCDGSLHYGDKDHADELPPRYHHGLRNLSAALDVGVSKFPKPKQILLAGSSAGGLGTIYAAPLVRLLYPEAKLFVFNDSGVGVSTPDGARAKLTRDEWGTQQLIPTSCAECLSSPHSTPVITWTLMHDPDVRVAIFSAYEDTVIADTFLMIGGPAFKQALLAETGKVTQAYPERVKRFYINGTKHTTAGNLQATMVGGVTIGQWLGYMLAGDSKWTDTLQ